MRRRDLLTGLAVFANGVASIHSSKAQAPRKVLRVGIATIQPRTGPLWIAFERRLKELGYADGENLAVEFIDLNKRPGSQSEAMKELVRRKADILVASGTETALKTAMAATVGCRSL